MLNFVNRLSLILKPYGPLLLRLGLGFVFLWSGLSKLGVDGGAIGVCTNRAEAVDFVKMLWWLPFDPEIFVIVQSYVEIILAVMFIVGWWVERAAAAAVALFVFFFAIMDFSLIWKNIGLLVAAAALWGSESKLWRVDKYLFK